MVLLCASLMSVWLNKKLDLESPRFTFDNCWFYCTVKGTPVGFTSLLQSFLKKLTKNVAVSSKTFSITTLLDIQLYKKTKLKTKAVLFF